MWANLEFDREARDSDISVNDSLGKERGTQQGASSRCPRRRFAAGHVYTMVMHVLSKTALPPRKKRSTSQVGGLPEATHVFYYSW